MPGADIRDEDVVSELERAMPLALKRAEDGGHNPSSRLLILLDDGPDFTKESRIPPQDHETRVAGLYQFLLLVL
jgi:hypothetical protein